MNDADTFIAFYGNKQIATGLLADMLSKTTSFIQEQATENDSETLLIFNERTGSQIDFDFRGSVEEVLERALPKRSAGRPKLGVTSREITLLPRHWQWLESQGKSASASLRLVVEEAMKRDAGEADIKKTLAVIDRIMMAMAGDLSHFEEASRSLNQRNKEQFEACIESWPKDIKIYLLKRLQSTLEANKTRES